MKKFQERIDINRFAFQNGNQGRRIVGKSSGFERRNSTVQAEIQSRMSLGFLVQTTGWISVLLSEIGYRRKVR